MTTHKFQVRRKNRKEIKPKGRKEQFVSYIYYIDSTQNLRRNNLYYPNKGVGPAK